MTAQPRKLDCAHITEAESRLIEGVIVGRTNEEIGDSLGIAAGTVKNRLSFLYAKVGASNRAQLSLWALEHWQCCAGHGRKFPRWDPTTA